LNIFSYLLGDTAQILALESFRQVITLGVEVFCLLVFEDLKKCHVMVQHCVKCCNTLHDKLIAPDLVKKNSLKAVELKSTLVYSQEPSAGPYPS
jgi:hypothetical protein